MNRLTNSPTVQRTRGELPSFVTVAFFLLISASAVAGGGLNTQPTKSASPARQAAAEQRAIPPDNAPRRVVKAIKAANEIRKTRYGMGRRPRQLQRQRLRLLRRGQLHAARRPDAEDADDLRIARRLGQEKKGKWITVYANSGHTYAMVAGLRWDTSGGGPRWHKSKRSRAGYKVRHYKGY